MHGINVVSPCYVLLAYCEQGDKGAGQFPCKGSQDLRIGADTAPLFLFPAGARSIAPNVMRRLDPNTIKYTNCTCRILGRRNRHAGTTPSSAVVRPPFTLRRSYRRRHRLVSFSSKSFRFGDVAALPIRSPRSVTDEYWYVASAAPIVRRSGGRGSSDILRKLHLI